MRSHGMRFECLRLRPHDHVGWAFSGQAEFDALARAFLAEGVARDELLMYITASPSPATAARLRDVLRTDAVRVESVADAYGRTGIVDAAAQRATFAAVLADAQARGLRGIRVAADNTPMVTDDPKLTAWMRWELTADRFMADNAVTGLCAFDRDKVDVNRLRHLSMLHPISSADSPVPQFRLFSDDGNLCIEGRIDSSAVAGLPVYLDVLPPKTGIMIDLAAATLASRSALTRLGGLADSGVLVTIRGKAAALSELANALPRAIERLNLQLAPAEAT